SKQCVVVLLRNPHDVEYLLPSITCLTAYGFRKCQIEAILKFLFQ
ncbi:MAG: hypothetical protein HY400_04505, partial [Elusimicrobia bacterium]|nr:hypothetical protein [Elusimicrobiota bacterium]